MLKTDFKDLIPVGGEKLYQITDSSTGAIIGNSVRIRRANGNVQNGDKYGAAEVNEERELINQLSNSNILINPDFRVWQRGEAFTDKAQLINRYSADMWRVNHTGLTSTLVIVKNFLYGGMSINKSNSNGDVEICQFIENADMYLDKDLALSFQGLSSNTQYSNETTFRLRGDSTNHVVTNNDYYFGATYVPTDNVIIVKFGIKRLSSIVLKYIKLEFGKKATPHIPRLYVEELSMCYRYLYPLYLLAPTQIYTDRTNTMFQFMYSVKMRIKPTLTITSTNLLVTNYGTDITSTITRVDVSESTDTYFRVQVFHTYCEEVQKYAYFMGFADANFY